MSNLQLAEFQGKAFPLPQLVTPAGNPISIGKPYLWSAEDAPENIRWVRVIGIDYSEGTLTCLDYDTGDGDLPRSVVPDELEGPMLTPELVREKAREIFACDGELGIDDDAALVCTSADRCNVSCWVWVSDDDADIGENDELSDKDREARYLVTGATNVQTAAEFHDDSVVSLGDDKGSYVSAWVPVSPEDTTEDESDESEADTLLSRNPTDDISMVLSLNTPEFFEDAAFIAWLNHPDTNVFTWHTKGEEVGEYSDVLVLIDGSCCGDGDSSDMPAHIWNQLVAYCKERYGKREGHYYMKLCNL